MTIRKRSHARIVLIALALVVSCAKAPPQLSPTGQKAWAALQVVQEAKVFRDVAVAGEQQKVLSTDTTRYVVEWHKSFLQSIQQYPNGWKATTVASLDELKKKIPDAERPKLEPYFNLLTTLLQGVSQ